MATKGDKSITGYEYFAATASSLLDEPTHRQHNNCTPGSQRILSRCSRAALLCGCRHPRDGGGGQACAGVPNDVDVFDGHASCRQRSEDAHAYVPESRSDTY